jgi:hypothetical protein
MLNLEPKFTPPQVARLYGVSHDKILGWIHAGELRAINIAAKRSARPRWVVGQQDLVAFERSRESGNKAGRQCRRQGTTNSVAFF